MWAGVHGVLPGRPAGQAWTGAVSLDRAAHQGPLTARCGAVLDLEVWRPAHQQGCNNTEIYYYYSLSWALTLDVPSPQPEHILSKPNTPEDKHQIMVLATMQCWDLLWFSEHEHELSENWIKFHLIHPSTYNCLFSTCRPWHVLMFRGRKTSVKDWTAAVRRNIQQNCNAEAQHWPDKSRELVLLEV